MFTGDRAHEQKDVVGRGKDASYIDRSIED
jgi:hypothetical protein